MTDRPGFLHRLRSVFTDLNLRAADQQFEARLDQEIHQAQEQIRQAQEQARAAQADRLVASQQLSVLRPELVALEEQVVRHLRARSPAKARPLTTRIAALSAQVRHAEVREAVASQHVAEQNALAEFHESVIQRLKRQLGLRRASINLQRSQEALSRFGDPIARSATLADADASPPETPEQVMARLRQRAASPSTSKKKGGDQ